MKRLLICLCLCHCDSPDVHLPDVIVEQPSTVPSPQVQVTATPTPVITSTHVAIATVAEDSTPVQVKTPVVVITAIPVPTVMPIELPADVIDCSTVLGNLEDAQKRNTAMAYQRGYDPGKIRDAQRANIELSADAMIAYPQCF